MPGLSFLILIIYLNLTSEKIVCFARTSSIDLQYIKSSSVLQFP